MEEAVELHLSAYGAITMGMRPFSPTLFLIQFYEACQLN